MLGKNRRKKVRKKTFFIFTRISWPINGGKKSAKLFFQKHKNCASKKCGKKDRREKGRINVFYIHTNIVTQERGGKTRETSFPESHEYCEQKMLGKRSSGKRAIKRFLYSHECRDQKKGGKKRAIQFFQKHTNSAGKKC